MVQHEPVNNNAVSSINHDLSIHTTGSHIVFITIHNSVQPVYCCLCTFKKKGRKQANEWGGKRKEKEGKEDQYSKEEED